MKVSKGHQQGMDILASFPHSRPQPEKDLFLQTLWVSPWRLLSEQPGAHPVIKAKHGPVCFGALEVSWGEIAGSAARTFCLS